METSKKPLFSPDQPRVAVVNGESLESFVLPTRRSSTPPEQNASYVRRSSQIEPKQAVPYRIKPLVLDSDSFVAIERLEGRVLTVEAETFTVRLANRTNPSAPEEEAQIGLDEIWEDDRPFLRPGAEFYWSIGYLRKRHGQRINSNLIRFKRLPLRSQQTLSDVTKKAQFFRSFLDLSNANSSEL